jgi:hypothetical protein
MHAHDTQPSVCVEVQGGWTKNSSSMLLAKFHVKKYVNLVCRSVVVFAASRSRPTSDKFTRLVCPIYAGHLDDMKRWITEGTSPTLQHIFGSSIKELRFARFRKTSTTKKKLNA